MRSPGRSEPETTGVELDEVRRPERTALDRVPQLVVLRCVHEAGWYCRVLTPPDVGEKRVLRGSLSHARAGRVRSLTRGPRARVSPLLCST